MVWSWRPSSALSALSCHCGGMSPILIYLFAICELPLFDSKLILSCRNVGSGCSLQHWTFASCWLPRVSCPLTTNSRSCWCSWSAWGQNSTPCCCRRRAWFTSRWESSTSFGSSISFVSRRPGDQIRSCCACSVLFAATSEQCDHRPSFVLPFFCTFETLSNSENWKRAGDEMRRPAVPDCASCSILSFTWIFLGQHRRWSGWSCSRWRRRGWQCSTSTMVDSLGSAILFPANLSDIADP